MSDKQPQYKTYKHPAGGWGAAAATAKVLMEQSVVGKGSRALLTMNQPGGFKCPSCAYPDPECKKTLEFCEKYDAPAFDSAYDTLPLDFFEPMLRRVMARPKNTIYKAVTE